MAAIRSAAPAGRLLELAVTDLALHRAAAADARARAQRPDRRDRRRQEPAHRRAGAGARARAPTRRSSGTARSARASRRCSTASPEPLIAVREVAAGGRSTARLDDEHRHRGTARRRDGAARRDPRPARPAAAPRRALAARPARRVRRARRGARGDGRRRSSDGGRTGPPSPSWSSTRASWPADSSSLEHEAAEIAAARLRPGRGGGDPRAARRPRSTARRSPAAARRSTRRSPARDGGARDAVAAAAPRGRGRSPGSTPRFEPLADRLGGPRGGAGRRRRRGPRRSPRPSTTIRRELDRLEERLVDDLSPASAATATTRRRSSPTASGRARRRSGCAAWTAERAPARAEDARLLRGGGRRGGARCRRCAARGRRRLGGGGRGGARGARVPGRACSTSPWAGGRPAQRRAGGRDRRRRGRVRRDRRRRRSSSGSRPNPGEPARPLARIASGGELSPGRARDQAGPRRGRRDADARVRRDRHRASAAGARTRSGGACGRSPARHQVLCVTHLPQIAAHADAHFRIAKRERDGRTVTEVDAPRPRGPDRGARPDARRAGGRRRRRSPRRGSCSTAPRRGAPRRTAAEPRGRRDRRVATRGATLDRGDRRLPRPTCGSSAAWPPATMRAYRADLADFAASAGRRRAGRPARTPRVATSPRGAPRPARRSGPRPDQPAPAGGEHPRLLPVRVRRGPDRRRRRRAPRPAAPAAAAARDARPSTRSRRSSRRPAATRSDAPATPTLRDRALLELLYAAGLRVSEALGPRPRGPLARRRLRPGHRQGRRGAARARSATSRSTGSAGTDLAAGRPWLAGGPRTWRRAHGAARCSSASRGGRLAAAAGVADRR